MILFSLVAHATEHAAAMTESQYDIISDEGRTFRIFVAHPPEHPPQGGWPVIWLLDGNMNFPLAKTEHPHALIVGIGYPFSNRDHIVKERYFDLTSKPPAEAIPLAPGQSVPGTGGADAFRRFLHTKLQGDIAARFMIDRTRQTLYGHSLGGFFALNMLLKNRYDYSTYCVADPAVWWNRHEIMSQFRKADRFNTDGTATKVEITISGKKAERPNLNTEQRQKLDALRSGPNGENVYQILSTVPAIQATFKRYDKLTHGSMVRQSIHDCLSFSGVLGP